MEIKEWPAGVNRIVLSDSGFGHNKNAVISDKSENGSEMSRLTASGSPDEWKVNMHFSNSREDSFFKKHGETEWERFVKWFKYTVAMGTIPFNFHKIGDSSETNSAVYKIRSDGFPSYTFSGTTVKTTVTFVEVFDDFITVNLDNPKPDEIGAYNGYVELWFTDKPENAPKKGDFSFTYNFQGKRANFAGAELVMEDFLYDGNKSCVFYYPAFSESGFYEVVLTLSDGSTRTDRFEV